jgi:hypothetical protein
MKLQQVQSFRAESENDIVFAERIIEQTRADICSQLCRWCREGEPAEKVAGFWGHPHGACAAHNVRECTLAITS